MKSLEMIRLAEAFEKVRRSCPTPAVEAVTWLHLKHPLDSTQKAFLQGSIPVSPRRRFPWFQIVLLSFYALYLSCLLLRVKLQYGRQLREFRRRSFDLVVKTWRFHPDRTTGEEDFYFGDLCTRLQRAGVLILRLFGNPNGRPWQGPPARGASTVAEIPEWCLVPGGAPIGLVGQICRASAHLRRAADSEQDPLLRRCFLQASADCLDRRFLPIALYASLGEAVARTWHPRILLTLYEGHAWEQCLWKGFRRVGSDARVAGYQHTVLMPYQMALLKPSAGDCVSKPDLLLCLGERTCEMLASSHPDIPRFAFGTFRKLPGAGSAPPEAAPPSRKTVLVLPEGHWDETICLFVSALETAKRLPDHRVVLRCHPVLPFEKVRGDLPMEIFSLPNIEISSSERIEEDFQRASAVLYRGSSAVLYAVLFGLKPFYLHLEGREVIDPLFELVAWRERVTSAESLSVALRRHAERSPTNLLNDWGSAKEYVRSYLTPVTDQSIRRLLNVVFSERPAGSCTA